MRKFLCIILVILLNIIIIHAEGKISSDYKIIIFGGSNENTTSLTEDLDKAKIKYTFYNLNNKDKDKWQEMWDKLKFYGGKTDYKMTLPVVFVNGCIITNKIVTLSDIKQYLHKKNSGLPFYYPDKINSSGIIPSSVKPDVYETTADKGLFYITFKMENAMNIYIKVKNSKNEDLPIKWWQISNSNYTYDSNDYMLVEKNNNLCKIWIRMPEADIYTCDVLTKYNTEQYNYTLQYKIDVIKGMDDREFYNNICYYGFDRNNAGLVSELLKKTKDMTGLVNNLLDTGLPVDYCDTEGNTFLYHAVKKTNIELIKKLLKKGADVNHKRFDGTTILGGACYIENNETLVNVVKLLIDNGADINTRGYLGQTFFFSFTSGLKENDQKTDIIKFLISSGADINAGDVDGITPMNVAKTNKNNKLYEYLKSIGGRMYEFQIPAKNDTPLYNAIINKDIAKIKEFKIEEFEKINLRTKDGIPSTALHITAELGDIDIIKTLCELKVNWNTPDRYKRTPLLMAVKNNLKDAAALLLKNNADPNSSDIQGTSSFTYAVVKNPDMMMLLLKTGIKPKNIDPLIIAIMSGNIEMVKKLFPISEKEIDPKIIDFAVDFGQVELTRYLCGIIDGLKDKSKELVTKAEYNHKRYMDYENKNKELVVPSRINGGIADKKGMFQYILEEWSPYTDEKADIDLKKLPVNIYIPKDYSADKPYGLMVFLSWNYPSDEYRKALDKHNLIWVGFNCYNIEYKPLSNDLRHEIFYLAVVYNMLKYYSIDPARIYLSGMSWGGRLTGRIIVKYPNIFKGGISMGGCQPDYIWNIEKNEFHPSLTYAQKNIKLVITAGDYDFNRDEAFCMYNYLIARNFKNIFYFQETGKYHEALSANNYDRALDWLESMKWLDR